MPTMEHPAPKSIFTVFSKLPIELRYKVWVESMPLQRLVEITYKYYVSKRRHRNQRIKTQEPVPTQLHICRESRSIALQKYSLQLDTTTRTCLIRIDPVNDRVMIGFDNKFEQSLLMKGTVLAPEALQTIQHLAINVSWGAEYHQTLNSSLERLFQNFTALKDLVFDIQDRNSDITRSYSQLGTPSFVDVGVDLPSPLGYFSDFLMQWISALVFGIMKMVELQGLATSGDQLDQLGGTAQLEFPRSSGRVMRVGFIFCAGSIYFPCAGPSTSAAPEEVGFLSIAQDTLLNR